MSRAPETKAGESLVAPDCHGQRLPGPRAERVVRKVQVEQPKLFPAGPYRGDHGLPSVPAELAPRQGEAPEAGGGLQGGYDGPYAFPDWRKRREGEQS